MAKIEETMNAVQKKSTAQVEKASESPKNMKDWIKAREPQIAKALPSVITPERFTRMAMTAISSNAQLAASSPQSFIGAMMNAAQLGLEPNTPLGQAYLIPFKNNRKGGITETQFQIGYKGLIDLAHRSGEFKTIYAKEVYEKDDFSYEYGLEPKLHHVPTLDADRGPIKFYYAVYTLVNGGFGFEVMTRAEIESHARKFSKAYSSGPWKTNFDEMAKKTVIKKVLKYAPIKTEFVRQVSEDQTITRAEKDGNEMNITSEDISYVEAEYEVEEVDAAEQEAVNE